MNRHHKEEIKAAISDQTGEVRLECPVCKGSQSKTLSANADTGDVICFRCGLAGNVYAETEEKFSKAEYIWKKSKPVGQHPYFKKKGVKASGLREDSHGNLVVPFLINNVISTLQLIKPDGKKILLKNCKKKGASFCLGNETDSDTFYIVEGFATGASVYEAKGKCIVVAIDAGNLRHVAESLRRRHPKAKLVFCADNDRDKPETDPSFDVGYLKAFDAANAVDGYLCMPEQPGFDFNDLHLHAGLDAVRDCIEAAVKAELEDEGFTDEYVPVKLDDFPIRVLHPNFVKVVLQASRAFAVPVEIPAAVLIFLAGVCIGRAIGVQVKRGWIEFPNLFLAIIARSGMGKSHCVRAFLYAIFKIEKERFEAYQEELKQYQMDLAQWKAQKDKTETPPEKPVWCQIYVEDSTEEALTEALAGNPKGILWYQDELSGLFANLGRYRSDGKSDGPKSRLMSAYDCGPWKRNRKSGDNEFIPHACLSILGTVQPGILPKLFCDADAISGFLPRFLFIRAESKNPPLWTDETFDHERRKPVDSMFERLLKFEVPSDGPNIVILAQEAKAVYKAWFNEQAAEPWTDFNSQQYEALSAKLRGQCARLALILHCMEACADNKRLDQLISGVTMKRAVVLADWFKTHQRHVWQVIENVGQITECNPVEKRVAKAILDLKSEIVGGMLPTSRIAEKVNEGVEDKFQVSSLSVGKCYKKLNLKSKHLPDKTGRGVILNEKSIRFLKSITPNVRNVRNVQETSANGFSEPDVYFSNVPNVPKEKEIELDVSDVSFSNVPSGELDKQMFPDVSDVSDMYRGENKFSDKVEL